MSAPSRNTPSDGDAVVRTCPRLLSRPPGVGGDAVEAVRELKAGGDGDLVAYGYGALSQALLEHDLVDALTFFIHPIVVATGTPAFRPGMTKRLRLEHTDARSTGVVTVSYGRD